MKSEKESARSRKDRQQGAKASKSVRNAADKARAASEQKMRQLLVAALVLAAVIVAVFALFFILMNAAFVSVPFSTFKANFDSAPRVAVFVTYQNQTQYQLESHCSSWLVQSISSSRNVSMDFYLLNQTNCTFSSTGIGHLLNGIVTKQASYCQALEGAEPSILLNYAPVNITLVRANQLTIYGNAAYMASCPIAVNIH